MKEEIIVFLHGYATLGGLKGAKAQFFHEKFSEYAYVDFHALDFNPTVKDFQYHTITGMIDRLRQYILDRDFVEINLIAISQGANVALNYTNRYGGVKRLLLLAPELFYDPYLPEEALKQWEKLMDEPVFHYGYQEELLLNYGHHQDGLRYVAPPPASASMLLIHGLNDQAVPIARSQKYAALYPDKVQLIEVESNHFLNNQHEQIWEHTKKLFEL